MMVGEVNLRETALIAPYLGDHDELHLAFDFESLNVAWDAGGWRARIAHVEAVMGERWPTWVFSNHDQPRMRTRLGGSEARARAAALLLLTLRGTPFLYAGEELGLRDAHVPPSEWSTPVAATAAVRRSRGRRAPVTAGRPTRGCRGRPTLRRRSAEAQEADPGSILHL